MSSSFSRYIFTKLFPPPRFLSMPAVGLDISDEAVRFVELKNVGNHYKLGIYGEKRLPPNMIELGFIKDIPGFGKFLGEIKKQYGLQFVKVSLPEEKAYLFRTTIPRMDHSEIRSALQFKIEENVPVPLQKAVYDYKFIKIPEPNDVTYDIGVTVVHTKVVSRYMQALEGAGLVPLEMRTESQAIAHEVIAHGDQDAHIIICLRETKTVLAVISRRVVQFTSTIPIGGAAIVAAIKNTNEHQADPAQDFKIIPIQEMRDSNEMFRSLSSPASLFRDEVQKLITYWNGHADVSEGKSIHDIIISGADVLDGVDSYLSTTFNIPVAIADAWKNVFPVEKELPQITRKDSLNYIPALGLALPYDN